MAVGDRCDEHLEEIMEMNKTHPAHGKVDRMAFGMYVVGPLGHERDFAIDDLRGGLCVI